MPAKRKYQSQAQVEHPIMSGMLPGALPFDRAIAVYYRQSSMKQVGNISTLLCKQWICSSASSVRVGRVTAS